MSLGESARSEFARSPITLGATVAGVLVSALALLVAWLQYVGQPQGLPGPPAGVVQARLNVSNLLVVTAFFFAATFSLASAVRLLGRVHGFAAVVLSVPAAVLASFCTMVMLNLVPPRQLSDDAVSVARDLVFYGASFLFIALNGRSVVQTVADPRGDGKSDMTVGGVLFGCGIAAVIWGSLVSAGLTKLVQVFLS